MHASHSRRCAALAAAIAGGQLNDEAPSAMFLDMDQLAATMNHLQHEAGYPGEQPSHRASAACFLVLLLALLWHGVCARALVTKQCYCQLNCAKLQTWLLIQLI